MRRFALLCVVALAAALCLPLASARDIHVAPDGDDGNPGTLERPMKSPVKAAKLLKAGDSLVFRKGEYQVRANGTYGLAPYADGTPDKPITFRNHNNEHVKLDLRGSDWGLTNNGYSYIVFDGLDITNRTHYGMKLSAASGRRTKDGKFIHGHHVTVRNCEVHHTGGECIFSARTEHLTVENCHLHHSGRSHGLYLQVGCHNAVIRNVTSEHNHGNSGTQLNAAKGGIKNALVERCLLRHNAQGWSLMGNKNCVFRHNILYNDGYAGPRGSGYREIILWTYGDTTCEGNIFENNTIVNLIPEGHKLGRLVHMKSKTARVTFRNNIFYVARKKPVFIIDDDSRDRHLFEHNCFFGGPMVQGVGDLADLARGTTTVARGNIREDPMFVDAQKGDLRLKEGSPCIGASTDGGDIGALPHGKEIRIGCKLPWKQ
ncbi:MAG: right-handed parallel beta-helix repeat-containing protein [Planctomycetota bacterium]